jgi:hypothetical protein
MLRRSVLGLGVVAAVGMSAIPVSAKDIYAPPIRLNANIINIRCSAYVDGAVPLTDVRSYRINLDDSTVNGEQMQIDRIDANNPKTPYPISENLLMEPIGAKGPKLGWHRPAEALVPAAYYLLDISKGRLDVMSDNDGREVKTLYRLRCANKLLKISA